MNYNNTFSIKSYESYIYCAGLVDPITEKFIKRKL